jgi:phage tail sheath protein FI
MNEAGINVIRKFGSTNPVTVWGCRTLSTDPNRRFLYINVRRFFQFVEKSIADSTRWAVHRNNNYKLWAKLTDKGDDFLSSLLVRGAFPTRVKELAFFIDVGTANGVMTQEDIDAGRVKGRIGMAANKPGEFLIWEFTQYDSGWAISE